MIQFNSVHFFFVLARSIGMNNIFILFFSFFSHSCFWVAYSYFVYICSEL